MSVLDHPQVQPTFMEVVQFIGNISYAIYRMLCHTFGVAINHEKIFQEDI